MIRNATDKLRRNVTIIPDNMARTLRAAAHDGWTEFHGMADGYSRSYPPGHPVHAMVGELYAHWTANGGFTSLIVGESGWDDSTSWWATSLAHHGLDMRFHVGPMPVRKHDGTVHFAG